MKNQLDKPKTRIYAPSVVALLAVAVLVVSAFAAGYWAAGQFNQPVQGKEVGQPFDRADYRLAGQPFVKEV